MTILQPRTHVVQRVDRPSETLLRKLMLEERGVESRFSTLTAPAPCVDDTLMKVIASPRRLLVGVCLVDTVPWLSKLGDQPWNDTVELLFSPWNDGMGYVQFLFGPPPRYAAKGDPHRDPDRVDEVQVLHHTPYPEARSSDYRLMRLRRYRWQDEVTTGYSIAGRRVRWLWAWFDTDEVFAHGPTCGFNICRHRPYLDEFSGWNYPSGNGAPDATGFGVLCKFKPPTKSPRGVAVRARPARSFTLSVEFDSPMNIISAPYTHDRLDAEMRQWKRQGVGRVHWIEYGDWPSFWHEYGAWASYYRQTVRTCGPMLPAAVKAAHRHGLEFVADLKTFDLGMNCFVVPPGPSAVLDLENKHVSAIPEIAAAQSSTMRAHPGLQREPSASIRKLRLYSTTPLPRFKPGDVELLVSGDNQRFRVLRGVRFRQGVVSRPHQRWTPVGPQRVRGSQRNWFIEFDGLKLTAPYAAVRFANDVRFTHRGDMIAEAIGTDGKPQPITVATNGGVDGGFFFWKGWQGWNNQTEALWSQRIWHGKQIGVVFRQADRMPTLLEPCDPAAHAIWLGRVQRIIDAGADGVSIRTYCHHNGPMCYMQYAYAPAVLGAFRKAFGRDPQFTPEDDRRIRQVRGRAYTRFIESARELTKKAGLKLMVEVESGVEVPETLDCRMQLPVYWRDWTRRGLVDELRMKWFTAHNPWVHAQVMPEASRAGVPVSLISRCLHTGLGQRAAEMGCRLIRDARAFGFAGYTLYEHQNLVDVNSAGRVVFKGPVEMWFEAARQALA